jgi:hypothetical protein
VAVRTILTLVGGSKAKPPPPIGVQMSRLALVLVLVSLAVLPGCVFGGDMTADKLEDKLLENYSDHPLYRIEGMSCRDSATWDFECTYTSVRPTYSTEIVMAFMYEGDEPTCASGTRTVEKGLPSPTEICPQLFR